MKKSTKAALLSALVFPGIGHFVLKKPVPGVALAGAAFAGVYFLMAKTAETAQQVTEKLLSGEVALDSATINELISEQSKAADTPMLNLAAAAFVIAWLIGIVDSYRVGRALDKEAED